MSKKFKLNWWQYFGVGSFVAGWIARAAMDGKITRIEIDELITDSDADTEFLEKLRGMYIKVTVK